MKREIQITSDGSTTIHLTEWNENYHSKHGAVQEAKHVFIKNGLQLFNTPNLAILEIGFGTGLNAFITYLESEKTRQQIHYVGVEAYPVLEEELRAMNYVQQLNVPEDQSVFQELHSCSWEKQQKIAEHFTVTKRQQRIEEIEDIAAFDLIYFDAFGYRVQPELWSLEIFKRMYAALKFEGILVTYAASGAVRRNMIGAGFEVEKLPGPPGKREMLRAIKRDNPVDQ